MTSPEFSDNLDKLQPISTSDRYPDPAADLEATLRLGARYSGKTALELSADREPTIHDTEIDARLKRIYGVPNETR